MRPSERGTMRSRARQAMVAVALWLALVYPSAGLAQRLSKGDGQAGASWLQLHPGSAPSPRAGESMTDDAARHEIVLFGGIGAAPPGILHDTWVWNGTTWRQEHPISSPPARAFAGMAYDGATRQIVLFGGSGANAGVLDDTWIWNGHAWQHRRPPASPPARSEVSLAYDAATKTVVLFGGSSPRGMAEPKLYNDTWTWDGRTWTEQKPARSPPARSQAAMAYVAVTARVTLFGGAIGRQLADTWTWNGRTWAMQHPTTAPPARASAGVAYDAHLRRMVLFGGVNIQGLTDTWTWNGATWAKVHVAASPPTGWNTAMAYDGRHRAVVLLLELVSKRVRHSPRGYPHSSAQMWMLDLASINLPRNADRGHGLEHPTRQEIKRRLRGWWVDPTDHVKWPVRFLVSRGPYTVADGRGGALTVVSGVACCGDGTGQEVFFWHNRTFIGMASKHVTDPVKGINSPRPGVLVVVFYGYRKSDARCCPLGPPVRADFRWDGRRLVVSGRVPGDSVVVVPRNR